jgi:hypothetical protein
MKKLEIIETLEYWFAVSDEEIKEGDLCYDMDGNPGHNGCKFIVKCLRTAKDSYWNKHTKKIIAYQPKDNALELDLPLLPEIVVEDEKSFIEKGKKHWDLPVLEKFEGGKIKSSTLKELIDAVIENTWEQCKRFLSNRAIEDDVETLAEKHISKEVSNESTDYNFRDIYKAFFIDGYNTATKVYSEDDLRGAITKAYLVGVERSNYGKQLEDDIIQSIKHPKTPKWFVAEREKVYHANRKGVTEFQDSKGFYSWKLKNTTINGKKYLVGTYKYE